MPEPLPPTAHPQDAPVIASEDIAGFAGFLAACGPVLALTGAGCSTDSGIPDYRDASGTWKRAAPITGQQFLGRASARKRYWARSMVGWPRFGAASPNGAHHALAALEHAGIVAHVLTQNVDGLHQRAGSRAVTELHGSLATVSCTGCENRLPRAVVQQQLEQENAALRDAVAPQAPDGDADLEERLAQDFREPCCALCGGVLRPDVVLFGENVPPPRLAGAMRELETAGALLCVGTSLMVYSGYRFCRRAAELGLPIVAINRGHTRADALFSLKLDGACAPVLSALAARLT